MISRQKTRHFGRRPSYRALVTLLLVYVAGCGGGSEINTSIRKSANERPDLDASQAKAGSIVIPAKTPFNLTSFTANQAWPGRGESEPIGHDGAKCLAEARDGGAAWGEFQLGYCFDNLTGRKLEAAVKMKVRVAETLSVERAAAPPGGEPTTAKSQLTFFLKDSNGILLTQEQILVKDLSQSTGTNSTLREMAFPVTFEADRGYYLVLSGRTETQAAQGESVNATLEVTQYWLEITWQSQNSSPGRAVATQPTSVAPAKPVS